MNATKTPGYNTRIAIAFTTDKNGKRIAYYLSRSSTVWRWIKMSLTEAELLVAQEQADQIPYVRNSPAR